MRELWLNEMLASRGGQGVKVLCPVSVDQGQLRSLQGCPQTRCARYDAFRWDISCCMGKKNETIDWGGVSRLEVTAMLTVHGTKSCFTDPMQSDCAPVRGIYLGCMKQLLFKL